MTERDDRLNTDSWLVAGGRPTEPGAPLNTPIVPASNFEMGDDREYARVDGTPTWEALEELLSGLERADVVTFSSGMAAISAVFHLVPIGGRIAIPGDCYQGVAGIAAEGETAGRWEVERIATDDTNGWRSAAATADLMWIESPSNPLLLIADLASIAEAHRPDDSLWAVDNTFATPLNQRPLDVGVDISVQSTTKFVGGHSDLLGGAVATRRPAIYDRLVRHRLLHGATPGGLEAFLALRGVRTLAVRMERSQASAAHLAERLSADDRVERVRYPGLSSDPSHVIASEQLAGFGSMISFDVAGGGDAADRVCRSLGLIRHATSLGGVESTIERRSVVAGQEHLPPGLLRLSVGIENADDLWADLDRALAVAGGHTRG